MPPPDPTPPTPPTPPTLVSLFVAPLNRLGVTYMVTGALAASIYGDPRLTHDVDMVMVLSDAEGDALHRAFDTPDFYVPPPEVIAAESHRPQSGHFNLIHGATAMKADVYIAGVDPLHDWALARRRPIVADGETVWLAPPEYVVLRKLQYFRDGGSDKHLQDVRGMLRQLGDAIDRTALDKEVHRLGLETQWNAVARSGPQ